MDPISKTTYEGGEKEEEKLLWIYDLGEEEEEDLIASWSNIDLPGLEISVEESTTGITGSLLQLPTTKLTLFCRQKAKFCLCNLPLCQGAQWTLLPLHIGGTSWWFPASPSFVKLVQDHSQGWLENRDKGRKHWQWLFLSGSAVKIEADLKLWQRFEFFTFTIAVTSAKPYNLGAAAVVSCRDGLNMDSREGIFDCRQTLCPKISELLINHLN